MLSPARDLSRFGRFDTAGVEVKHCQDPGQAFEQTQKGLLRKKTLWWYRSAPFNTTL